MSTGPVRVGYFHGGRTNLFYRAYIHGCFGAAGADVELYTKKLHGKIFSKIETSAWLEGGDTEGKASGVELVDKIAGGEFDAGTIGEASFLDAIQRRLPVVAVALLGHQTEDKPGHAIILRTGVAVDKPADLKGKTLISRRAGPMDEVLLREFVVRMGLDPDKDVKIIPQVAEDDAISLLADGKIDGGFYHLLLAKLAVEKKLGYIYRPMDWANPAMLQALLVFNADYARKNPEKVQKVVDAYVARIAYEHALPEEKKDRSGMKGMMMKEDFRGLSIPAYDDEPKVRLELLAQARDLLLKHGGLKSAVDIAPSVDNSFVERAVRRLKEGKLAVACAPHARLPFRNVILLGWDGVRRARLQELLAQKRMPNLQRFIDEGRWVDTEVTTGNTDTKAGWAQILTGYDPAVTGVYDNRERYDAIPEGYTLPERLKKAFGDGIETIFLAGKSQNLGTRGPHRICANCERTLWFDEELFARSKVPKEDRQIVEFGAEPYHLAYKHIDYFENGLRPMARVGPKVLEQIALNKDRRFFLFVEFEEPDEQGHVYGEGSDQYRDALLGLDGWLGRIRGRLQEEGLTSGTLIYLTTDHGFKEGGNGHRNQPHTFLITNDGAVDRAAGDRKDVTPTILDRFGVDLGSATPPLNGRSLLGRD